MSKLTVHRVYWTEENKPQSKDFSSEELDDCLRYCESLRKFCLGGRNISFISVASENPNCVSLQGVDVVTSEYSWKKRRK